MTRTIVLAGLLIPALAFGGKKDKDKGKEPAAVDANHANHFKAVPVEGGDVKVGVEDAWARDLEAKAKLVIENTTGDYLVFKQPEAKVNIAGSDYTPKGGLMRSELLVLEPKDRGSRVLEIEAAGLHQDTMTIVPSGIYLVSKDAPVLAVEDFQLPLAKSEIGAEGFSCTVPKKIVQETDETIVKFKCDYTGDGVLMVDPRQIQVRLEDGQVFANDGKGMDAFLVMPGDEFKFEATFHVSAKIVDMQFATMHMVFNEMFRAGEPRPVELQPIALELDPALTAAKND